MSKRAGDKPDTKMPLADNLVHQDDEGDEADIARIARATRDMRVLFRVAERLGCGERPIDPVLQRDRALTLTLIVEERARLQPEEDLERLRATEAQGNA